MKAQYDAAMLNLNAIDCDGRTPMHCAAKQGSVEMVHHLIKSGSSVNALDNDKQSPLQYAKTHDVIDLLKKSGVNHEHSATSDLVMQV